MQAGFSIRNSRIYLWYVAFPVMTSLTNYSPPTGFGLKNDIRYVQRMHTQEIKGPFTLSEDSPTYKIFFNLDFKNRLPSALQISVDSLSNQEGANFSVKLYGITNLKDSFFLGSFTAYPINKAGSFLMSARKYIELFTSDLKRKENEKNGKGVLKFVLVQYSRKALIRVHIKSVSWVFEMP
jgi:hypothetical protein